MPDWEVGTDPMTVDWTTNGGGGPSGPIALTDLTDVDVAGVSDGDVLTFDQASGDWIGGPAGGSLALDQLTDVDAAAPADGDVLTFDSGSGDWIAAAIAAGAGGGWKAWASTPILAGNELVNWNPYQDVAGQAATVVAAAGDLLLIVPQYVWFSDGSTSNGHLRLQTIVSAAAVNDIEPNGWVADGDVVTTMGAPYLYVVDPADLDGGSVTLQAQVFLDFGDHTLLQGSFIQVLNLGPAAPSPTPAGVRFAETVVTADVAANSATWADMTGYECEVQAQAGDVVDLFLCTYPNAFAANAQLCLDIGTIVSAAVVNRVSGSTGNGDLGCVESFQVQGSGQALYGAHIGRRYVVQAGDVEGGTVTFRGLYRNPVASCTLSAAANTIRSLIQATNLGAGI